MQQLERFRMKIFSESLIQKIVAGLLLLASGLYVDSYIDNIEIENYIIKSRTLLKAIIMTIVIVLLILALYIIPKIKNRRKIFKKYNDTQIKIAKDILNNKIQNINDFLDYFQACPQHKPFNSSDKNTNLLILDNEKDVDKLLKEFKDIMNDIIKYEYIEIEIDNNIEIFTYLKYHDNSKKEVVISHEMGIIFNNKFKQNKFAVKNHKRLERLIKLKALPEPIQP